MKNLIKNIITDLKVKLGDEFDRNFERNAFFDKKWDTKTKINNHRGALMQRSGKLRRSLNSKTQSNSVIFTSNMPYAQIHNEGGTITVTAKMKRFFWYQYKKHSKGDSKPTKEALQWKALALKKAGSKITIPQRQFIGLKHPEVQKIIEQIIDYNINEYIKTLKLKP